MQTPPETTCEHLRNLAQANSAQLLKKAANFASLHCQHTLWQRRMGTGPAMVLVRLEWPGVLCVYDPKTGNKLATSAPGHPETLQKI